ncbi:desampylase [Halorarius litoreus]|uniref:desampylase n=1 Tax=Halorarius litoreus TaxID=2962676 RepID=UPI0020CD471A|nr:desampylase [Halorarius litoreus]
MRLGPGVREVLLDHAREGAPEEVCGVLGGRRNPDVVTGIRRVPNVAASPEMRYELDPAAQLSAMEAIEDSGDEVVGFYHSHPRGPPGPSETDARLATWSGYRYCIVSLPDESVGAWRWTGEAFESVPVTEG